MNTTAHRTARPYPWHCPACGQEKVYQAHVTHSEVVDYEGEQHEILAEHVPVGQCRHCDAVYFSAASRQVIGEAVRRKLGLLTAQEIKVNRQQLDQTQQELAAAIGFAGESLCRWERGTLLQSRTTDNVLRAYFGLPVFRQFLQALPGDRSLGRTVRFASYGPRRIKGGWLNSGGSWDFGMPAYAASGVLHVGAGFAEELGPEKNLAA